MSGQVFHYENKLHYFDETSNFRTIPGCLKVSVIIEEMKDVHRWPKVGILVLYMYIQLVSATVSLI